MNPEVPLSHFSLPFNPVNLKRRYGFIVRYSSGETQQKVHYEADIAWQKGLIPGEHTISICKNQIYINDAAPNTLMEMVADKFGKVIYPLSIRLDKFGHYSGIANCAEISTRWQAARPVLAQYYTGPTAAALFKSMDAAVTSERYLSAALANDWLISLLFAPVCGHYTDGAADRNLQLPVIPYKPPVLYTARLQAAPAHTESGFLVIEANGVCADTRSIEDIVRGTPVAAAIATDSTYTPARGRVALTYKLYPHNGTVFSVIGKCNLHLPGGVEKTVEVELYQLGASDKTDSGKEQPSLIVDDSGPEIKKKPWYSIF